MKLNELVRDHSVKSGKRIGRGIGSGKGKTAGMGHKGQKARSGVAINAFEGGQQPLYRRLPKRGFTSINKKNFQIVSIDALNFFFEAKKLTNSVSKEDLKSVGLIRSTDLPVKVLGSSLEETLDVKFSVEADKVSKSVEHLITLR